MSKKVKEPPYRKPTKQTKRSVGAGFYSGYLDELYYLADDIEDTLLREIKDNVPKSGHMTRLQEAKLGAIIHLKNDLKALHFEGKGTGCKNHYGHWEITHGWGKVARAISTITNECKAHPDCRPNNRGECVFLEEGKCRLTDAVKDPEVALHVAESEFWRPIAWDLYEEMDEYV